MANFIQKVISHPGALKAAAAKNDRTTLEEAEAEAKSKNPHIRGRGILGERLISGDLHKMRYKGAHEK